MCMYVLFMYYSCTHPQICTSPGKTSPVHISICPFLCRTCVGRHAGQVQLSMVAHMTEVWVNVTVCIIVGVLESHLVSCRWDELDDVPPLAHR